MSTKNSKKIDYKWVIAFACFLIIFIGLGFCSSAKSIYIAPITKAHGFSRSAFSISDSLRYVVVSTLNVFFALLVKKFGIKKLIGVGLFSLILYAITYAIADSLIGFYLGGILLGIGVTFSSTAMIGVVINRWFTEHKGTVLGIVLASNGVGAAIAVQLFTPIIYKDNNPYGYRNSYFLLAAIIFVLMVVIMVLFKDKAPELNENTNKTDNKKNQVDAWIGLEYKTLLKRPYFYLIIVAILFGTLTSLSSAVTPYLTDVGMTPDFMASTTSISLVALALSKIMVGFIYDKFGIKLSLNICYIATIVSKVLLFFIENTPMGKTTAILHSIIGAIGTPIETVMLPILALAIFGQRNYDKVLGLLVTVTAVGQALSGLFVNLAYDFLGSYQVSFLISTAASVIILIVVNYAMVVSNKDKNKM